MAKGLVDPSLGGFTFIIQVTKYLPNYHPVFADMANSPYEGRAAVEI